MKKLLSISIVLVGFAFLLNSCQDDVNVVYGCTNSKAENFNPDATIDNGSCEGIYGCTDSTATNYEADAIINCGCQYENVRRVLVEDYTGHYCGNCPRAAETLHDLECKFGNQVIPMAVHVGFFASPIFHGEPYTTDHTAPEGQVWDGEFGNSAAGLPNGTVNRKEYSGTVVVAYPEWETKVDEFIAIPADAELTISTNYDSGSRNLNVSVETEFFNAMDASDYNLTVCILEDSVKAAQLDYESDPTTVYDYKHMHIFRGSMNGEWGETVTSSAISAGQTFNNSYSTTLDQNYEENNVYIVAFIYDDASKQVIQANKSSFINQ